MAQSAGLAAAAEQRAWRVLASIEPPRAQSSGALASRLCDSCPPHHSKRCSQSCRPRRVLVCVCVCVCSGDVARAAHLIDWRGRNFRYGGRGGSELALCEGPKSRRRVGDSAERMLMKNLSHFSRKRAPRSEGALSFHFVSLQLERIATLLAFRSIRIVAALAHSLIHPERPSAACRVVLRTDCIARLLSSQSTN